MKSSLADVLVCTETGAKLTLKVREAVGDEILEGELVSTNGRSYPIIGGVPRMAGEDLIDAGQKETRETFSSKWRRASDFGHEPKSRSFYVNWYLERYEFKDTEALGEFLRRKRRILDAGTGTGRDTRLYSELCSSGEVFGVDISKSIEFAYEHLKDQANVHLVQADITRLPFPAGFFDFIACDQVIHHTPNTEQTFYKLVNCLAPGGDISIYVYRKKAPIRELSDDYLRSAARGMSDEETWELAEQLTELGRALSELNAKITAPDVPALGIKAGVYDVQRFIYWHMLKCYWNPDLSYGDSLITNYDWYRPLYAHRHSAGEVRNWFANAGLTIVTFHECQAGVSVRGHKPAGA
jgi:SAM-dependent methyltransferase